jgi:hypothetical protein
VSNCADSAPFLTERAIRESLCMLMNDVEGVRRPTFAERVLCATKEFEFSFQR